MNNTKFVQAFIGEHGEHVQMPRSNFVLFEDGARMELSSDGLGATAEPPTDEYERCQCIEKFYELRLQQAISDFDQYRNDLVQTAHAASKQHNVALLPDRQHAVSELKRLRGFVMRAQKKLLKAKEETQANKPHWLRHREQAAIDSEAKANSFLADISSVQI